MEIAEMNSAGRALCPSIDGLDSHDGSHGAREPGLKPMLITTDLKTRLSPEFFARLISQLKLSKKPALFAFRGGQNKQSAALLEVKFDANIAHYGRMRMAALQT